MGSRHSLDQRTLHKLVQRKTGLLEKIATCITSRLHSRLHTWQEKLRHKAENTHLQVTRGLQLRLLATDLTSIKPRPPPSQLKRLQTLLCLSQDPLFLKMKIIWEGSQPRKGMKDCTSQVSWRRL